MSTVSGKASRIPETRQRADWLDVARGLGIFLVFYGHLVERFMQIGLPGTFIQFKWIYSFHMPMFFVFGGLLASGRRGPLATLKHGLLTRIVPAFFFNLILLPAWLPPFPLADSTVGAHLGHNLLLLFEGKPNFNFLTWFLFCLFVVELLHAILRRVVHHERAILASVIVLYGAGYQITSHAGLIRGWTGIPNNFWMLHEAIVALAFYQTGYLWSRMGALEWRPSKRLLVSVAASCWVGVAFSFNLNRGPFAMGRRVVIMALSIHGDPLYFPLTALLGTVGIAALAMLWPRLAPARWVGRYSLLFLGLDGFFFVCNAYIADRLIPYMPDSGGLQVAVISVATLICVGLSAPIASALVHGLPQLVGMPYAKGPILPAWGPSSCD